MRPTLERSPLEQQLLLAANAGAARRGQVTLGVDELLLAVIERDACVAMLRRISPAADRIVQQVRESSPATLGSETFRVPKLPARIQISRAWTDVLARAGSIAIETESEAGPVHILAAALEVAPEAKSTRVMVTAGLSPALILRDLLARRSTTGGREATTTPTLDRFGQDLTALAGQDKLDPLIGREREVRRCLQILNRRVKNNPLLVGEPGVGKTAIVEGIAQWMSRSRAAGERRLVSLDLARVVAGTRYRGEFEERLGVILDEIVGSRGRVIVFIDELHRLIGAGAAVGAIDASSMMKPLLARGSLQVIGATTPDDFRTHVVGDRALERRFQPVPVAEATPEETLAILRGIRPRYEAFHGVGIDDAALEAAVSIATDRTPDRRLPDKAIDLVDEACAAVRLNHQGSPHAITVRRQDIVEVAAVVAGPSIETNGRHDQ